MISIRNLQRFQKFSYCREWQGIFKNQLYLIPNFYGESHDYWVQMAVRSQSKIKLRGNFDFGVIDHSNCITINGGHKNAMPKVSV